MRSVLSVLLVLIIYVSSVRGADSFGEEAQPVTATLLADVDAVVPGESFTLGLHLKIKPHWHTYWIHPGVAGMPTSIKIDAPGLKVQPIAWPIPKRMTANGFTSFGYENEVLHLIKVTASKDIQPGQSITLDAKAQWLACKENCVEGKKQFKLQLPVREKANAVNKKLFDLWRSTIPLKADSKAGAKYVAGLKQVTDKQGVPLSQFKVTWKNGKPPAQLAWYPVPIQALAIEKIKLSSAGGITQVAFHAEVFSPEELGDGVIGGVLVFKTSTGQTIGIHTPLRIAKPK